LGDAIRNNNNTGEPTIMCRKLFILFLGLGILAAFFAAAQLVHASLGGTADSIISDRKVLSAVRGVGTAIVRDGYTIHTITSDSTTVREYLSPSGVVFGIAWNGLVHPDLTRLLGSYAGEYKDALRQTPRVPGRKRLQVRTNSIVVEKWGHMRNLQGRAYIPSLIPSGASVDDIK
jgi:hypothetical protein